MLSGRNGAGVDDATVDGVVEVTVAYLKAALIGDGQSARLFVDRLGADVLLVGVTAAMTSTIRASDHSPDDFLAQLLGEPAPPVAPSAFFRSL